MSGEVDRNWSLEGLRKTKKDSGEKSDVEKCVECKTWHHERGQRLGDPSSKGGNSGEAGFATKKKLLGPIKQRFQRGGGGKSDRGRDTVVGCE